MATKKTTPAPKTAATKPDVYPKTSPLIPVRQISFVSPQDGNGIAVASSVTACHGVGAYGTSKHRIFFDPRLNQFKMLFYADKKTPVAVQYVPIARVMCWSPMTDADDARVPFEPRVAAA